MSTFEIVSTALFLGPITIGFGSIFGIVFYNIGSVLAQEATQFPVFAALYLLFGVIGALFLAESMTEPKAEDEEEVAPQAPMPRPDPMLDPIPFEEDPAPVQ